MKHGSPYGDPPSTVAGQPWHTARQAETFCLPQNDVKKAKHLAALRGSRPPPPKEVAGKEMGGVLDPSHGQDNSENSPVVFYWVTNTFIKDS